eukprot:4732310-Pleurochrysis_carterae.AAC.4
MPTHARESMRALEYAERGLTAKARQPNGRMLMMRGLSPDVYVVSHGVVPEGDRRAASGERRAGEFHDGPDGALSDAVQLVDVWRAGGVVRAAVGKVFREFGRQELARVVAVQRANRVPGGVATPV